MPVDTRNKRMSMIGLALASPSVMANPDGTIDAADRAQLNWLYVLSARYARIEDTIVLPFPVKIDFVDIEEEKITFE